MSPDRKERLARNEAHARSINESLASVLERAHLDGPDIGGFLCECARADCEARVPIRIEQYERVREDSRRFVICPGHEFADVEEVIERCDDYFVVEKNEDVRHIVEQHDPRRKAGQADTTW
jgi:hypothetical protein